MSVPNMLEHQRSAAVAKMVSIALHKLYETIAAWRFTTCSCIYTYETMYSCMEIYYKFLTRSRTEVHVAAYTP